MVLISIYTTFCITEPVGGDKLNDWVIEFRTIVHLGIKQVSLSVGQWIIHKIDSLKTRNH